MNGGTNRNRSRPYKKAITNINSKLYMKHTTAKDKS